jgi:hypothetical protein
MCPVTLKGRRIGRRNAQVTGPGSVDHMQPNYPIARYWKRRLHLLTYSRCYTWQKGNGWSFAAPYWVPLPFTKTKITKISEEVSVSALVVHISCSVMDLRCLVPLLYDTFIETQAPRKHSHEISSFLFLLWARFIWFERTSLIL